MRVLLLVAVLLAPLTAVADVQSVAPTVAPPPVMVTPAPTTVADHLARKSYDLDWWSAWIAVAVLGVYALQAWFMRRAVMEAKASADAAMTSAIATKASTDAMLLRMRPRMYVQPERKPMFQLKNCTSGELETWLYVDVHYWNLGGSPAWVDAERTDFEFIPATATDTDVPGPPSPSLTFDVQPVVEARDSFPAQANSLMVSPEQFAGLRHGTLNLLVHGAIGYRDLLGDYHTTMYCWIYRYLGSERDRDDPNPPQDPSWGLMRGPSWYNKTTTELALNEKPQPAR